jgi:hypothetical protein
MLSRRHSIAWLYPSSVARATDNILRQAWYENRLSVGAADLAAGIEKLTPWPVAKVDRMLIRAAYRRHLQKPLSERLPK